jgi:FkbM family methyltransferase
MDNLKKVMVRCVKRRNPFHVAHVPWLGRIYRYPYTKWQSPHRLQVFGAPWLMLYALLRRISPVASLGTCELDVNGRKTIFRFDARNAQFQALYLPTFSHGYEPEVMALLDLLLMDDGVFYDIGSNWGYFSVYAASRPGFRGRVHAFEPFASTYNDLRSIVRQAALEAHISCEACALSDYDGAGRMKLPDFTHSGLASLESQTSESGGVKVARLDSLKLTPPTVMKIDAEGSEAAVLAGASGVINKHRPYVIFESWRNIAEPDRALQPWVMLRQWGYVFYHPAWVQRHEKLPPFLASDKVILNSNEEMLALVPLSLEERFLHQDQVNVLACPAERVSDLRSRFSLFEEMK